jgi:predicted ArsR family transcriptional regulator
VGTESLPLFAQPTLPPSVPVDTSEAAADSMVLVAGTLRFQVYTHLTEQGGATCDEVEVALELRHQTAAARLWELERAGWVEKSALKRINRSGRSAHVYVVRRVPGGSTACNRDAGAA